MLYVGIGSASVFVIALVAVITSSTGWLDGAVGTIFPRSEFLTTVMKAITFLGEAESLILIGVLITMFSKDKKDGAQALAGLGVAAGLNSLIKKLIRRPRPGIVHLISESGFSFPSGHSASSMMFYGFLIYLVQKRCKKEKVKMSLSIMLASIILAIGASRIYLGVHYASDVIGGFAFGLTLLSAYILFLDSWKKDK